MKYVAWIVTVDLNYGFSSLIWILTVVTVDLYYGLSSLIGTLTVVSIDTHIMTYVAWIVTLICITDLLP